jgi:hypothetical protein
MFICFAETRAARSKPDSPLFIGLSVNQKRQLCQFLSENNAIYAEEWFCPEARAVSFVVKNEFPVVQRSQVHRRTDRYQLRQMLWIADLIGNK